MIDVVIIGGGVIGSAVAFNLLSLQPTLSVAVIERDPTYRRASSALSVSSIRQQFSTPVNVAMSRYGMEFFKNISAHLTVDGVAPHIGLVERGYLYLASEGGRETLRANHAVQRECGVDVELLGPEALSRRFPWLSTTGLALGSLGRSGEGWFDGYSVLQAFRRKAQSLGAAYITGEVVGLDVGRRAIEAVVLADAARIPCGCVVNAAGPHAGAIARMARVELPVHPEKRCVFVFDCKQPPPSSPLVVDPSGLYFRPEGRYFIAGPPRPAGQPPADAAGLADAAGSGDGPGSWDAAGSGNSRGSRDGQDLEVDYALFDEVVWPTLAARVPAFETLKLVSAWAGFYEMNAYDHNALLGTSPEVANLYLANGFSGHGMQHSPAAGRGIAELILFGAYRTLDLRALSYDRFTARNPTREANVI